MLKLLVLSTDDEVYVPLGMRRGQVHRTTADTGRLLTPTTSIAQRASLRRLSRQTSSNEHRSQRLPDDHCLAISHRRVFACFSDLGCRAPAVCALLLKRDQLLANTTTICFHSHSLSFRRKQDNFDISIPTFSYKNTYTADKKYKL